MSKVPSVCVDHRELQPGLYLREVKKINCFTKLKIWDLRFVAPSAHTPLSASVMHSIEHIFAVKLRELIPESYVGFYIHGCKTGFSFVSKNSLSYEDLRQAIITAIYDVCPICSREEIPHLNDTDCGNPNLYAIKDTNTALWNYKNLLEA